MKCRLCHNEKLELYYTQGDRSQYHFYKCTDCGLVNLDLRGLDLTDHQEKYATEYTDPFDPVINRGSLASFRFVEKQIEKTGRFLDVGCGNGALLAAARDGGWDVKGLELSNFLADKVRGRLGIEVESIDFLESSVGGGPFDLVSLRHVLEHLPDSLGAMKKIHELLRPGGHALLEFPNVEGVSFKTKRILERLGIRRKKYSPAWRPGHCNEFCRNSFSELAVRTGFRVVVWETYSHTPVKNRLYNLIPIGTKARVLVTTA